jgi:hypothetical protein
LGVLLFAFGPAPGDAEVHLYRTFLVRHGAFVWDNFWYEGDFPLVAYSLLYYFPAALVGNVPLVVASVIASSVLFASISMREWGPAAVWPSRVFAIFAVAPLFTGLYSYSLGFTMLLATVRSVQAKRSWLAIVFAALCLGFSPLAFAFLCLVLASILIARRRISGLGVHVIAGIAVLVGFEALLLGLFPSGGTYPFHLINLAGVLLVCVSGALLAHRSERGRPLLVFFVLWGLGSCIAAGVPSPIGGNWTRLSEIVFPVMLLTATLAGRRGRRLAMFALLCALVYDLAGPVLLIPYRLDNRPAGQAFWQPAIHFLDAHNHPGFRVEVVPTAAHWESYWIPHAGFALARGWYRQLDMVDNSILYSKHLSPEAYEGWLRAGGVDFVLLPSTALDPIGGHAEATAVRSPNSDLHEVFHDKDVAIFALARPTPILTGPASSRITEFGHTLIAGYVMAPGRYLLRVHYVPFWRARGGICTQRARSGMTWLDASRKGPFTLSVVSAPEALLLAVDGDSSSGCKTQPVARS